MKNRKLITLLMQLDGPKKKKFRLFLKSPYHNQSELSTALFNELIKNIENIHSGKTNLETVLSKVDIHLIEHKAYGVDRLSKLYKLLRSFLINEALNNNDTLQTVLLQESLKKIQHSNSIKKLYQQHSSKLKGEIKSEYSYLLEVLVDKTYFDFQQEQHFAQQLKSYYSPGLFNRIQRYYYLSKLKLKVLYLRDQLLYPNHYATISDLESIDISKSQVKKHLQDPLLNAYFMIYQLFENRNANDFTTTKNNILNLLPFLHVSEQSTLLFLINAFCIAVLKDTKKIFEEIQHNYNTLYKNGYFDNPEHLNPMLIHNIINVAEQSETIDWAEKIIADSYSKKSQQDSTYYYASGFLLRARFLKNLRNSKIKPELAEASRDHYNKITSKLPTWAEERLRLELVMLYFFQKEDILFYSALETARSYIHKLHKPDDRMAFPTVHLNLLREAYNIEDPEKLKKLLHRYNNTLENKISFVRQNISGLINYRISLLE